MRNVFTNLPVEFHVPKFIKTIFVSDFFVNEVQGGAELTTEALITQSPNPNNIFKMHASSLTEEIVKANKDKIFILTNFISASVEGLAALTDYNVKYYIIEYDYKYCRFRSEGLHLIQTKKACDCYKNEHIKEVILKLFMGAEAIFWMSEAQKKHQISRLPELAEKQSYVLSSVFDEFSLNKIEFIYNSSVDKQKNEEVAILSKEGSTWIKGIESTEAFLKLDGKKYLHLPKKPYYEFLVELSKYKTFCFRPSDKDTCPRVTIEAKLLGLDLILNKNVQHKDEPWFNGSREEMLSYLKSRPSFFWERVK